MTVVELFAGPGGSSTGLRMAGYTGPAVGLEWDLPACRTAVAADHTRICADVSTYPPGRFTNVEGLIASPPCQAWSRAGKRGAEIDQTHLLSLSAGGAPADPTNLWPEPRTGKIGERAKDKDDDEHTVQRDICAGRITLKQGQDQLLAKWSR